MLIWLLACGTTADELTTDRPVADLQTATANLGWYNGTGGEYNTLGFGDDGGFYIGRLDYVELDDETEQSEELTGDLESSIVTVSSTTDPLGRVDSLTFAISGADVETDDGGVDVAWDIYGVDEPDEPWRYTSVWAWFELPGYTTVLVGTSGDGPEQVVDGVFLDRTVYLDEAFEPEGVTFVAISLQSARRSIRFVDVPVPGPGGLRWPDHGERRWFKARSATGVR